MQEANKAVVRRLVDEVLNGGHLELIAEGDKVVGRFSCSATHLGAWLGHAATGRRFERVDEVAIFQLRDGRIVHVWSLEDNLGRLQQLGLF